jgi:hypothetical protein
VTGAACKIVVVTVSKNSQTLATVTFMLANFLEILVGFRSGMTPVSP